MSFLQLHHKDGQIILDVEFNEQSCLLIFCKTKLSYKVHQVHSQFYSHANLEIAIRFDICVMLFVYNYLCTIKKKLAIFERCRMLQETGESNIVLLKCDYMFIKYDQTYVIKITCEFFI